ncbi:MAG: BrnA antitoxin family protein [Steroidobacteraceae bacterium]
MKAKIPAKLKLRRNTAAEEVRIQAGIKADPDTRELTAEDFKRMRPFHEVMGEYRRRGRPKSESSKEAVSLRLPPEVLAFFRASGRGWQTRVTEALIAYVRREQRRPRQ